MKFLIAGYGSIGKRHLKNILSNSNSKIIIYSKRKDLSNLEKKNIKVSNSLDKCLDENPNAALITNETSNHIPISKKLAQAGLDLFIEKPLSNSLKSVSDVIKITKNKKLMTLMGCNLRFHDCIKKIK